MIRAEGGATRSPGTQLVYVQGFYGGGDPPAALGNGPPDREADLVAGELPLRMEVVMD